MHIKQIILEIKLSYVSFMFINFLLYNWMRIYTGVFEANHVHKLYLFTSVFHHISATVLYLCSVALW